DEGRTGATHVLHRGEVGRVGAEQRDVRRGASHGNGGVDLKGLNERGYLRPQEGQVRPGALQGDLQQGGVVGVLELQAGADDVPGRGGVVELLGAAKEGRAVVAGAGQTAARHNTVRGGDDDIAGVAVAVDEDQVGPAAAAEEDRGVGVAVGVQVEDIAVAAARQRRAVCRRGAVDVEGVVAGEGVDLQRLDAAIGHRGDGDQRLDRAGAHGSERDGLAV